MLLSICDREYSYHYIIVWMLPNKIKNNELSNSSLMEWLIVIDMVKMFLNILISKNILIIKIYQSKIRWVIYLIISTNSVKNG